MVQGLGELAGSFHSGARHGEIDALTVVVRMQSTGSGEEAQQSSTCNEAQRGTSSAFRRIQPSGNRSPLDAHGPDNLVPERMLRAMTVVFHCISTYTFTKCKGYSGESVQDPRRLVSIHIQFFS